MPRFLSLSISTHPIAVLGVRMPYIGGSTASSRARDTPDSATNFAVCLNHKLEFELNISTQVDVIR